MSKIGQQVKTISVLSLKKSALELLLFIYPLTSIQAQKALSKSQQCIILRTNTLENYDDYKSLA